MSSKMKMGILITGMLAILLFISSSEVAARDFKDGEVVRETSEGGDTKLVGELQSSGRGIRNTPGLIPGPNQGFPGWGQGFPNRGFPGWGQGFPNRGFPGWGQGFPNRGFPGQNYPGLGFPWEGFPGPGQRCRNGCCHWNRRECLYCCP